MNYSHKQIGLRLIIDDTDTTVRFDGIEPKPGALPIDYTGYWRTSALNSFYNEIGQYLRRF